MGIKGIYRELGSGKRVALSKLAADSFEAHNRPYRIAIDIAIWQFQTQAARGGTNPAIRTLFYRLVRLMGTPIQPIFVFDGPNKPTFKRNKRSGRGNGVATAMAKRLIRLFGFPVHDAPGEAEAECALLQKHGVVDAVLSEDVDTIMFGCTTTLRNWSAEGKSSKTPTHVSLYDVHEMALAGLGLDREGMVLVALMSGGDYLPDGIPGCGVKVACEAAKAGFGKSICRLKASDKDGIAAWRQSLVHELQTNESGHFRTKHKALTIPEDFPNLEVLRYYTHPVVSPASTMDIIRQKMAQKVDIQLEDLREFTRETFDWDYRIGAIKFIRVLGQALLVQKVSEMVEADKYVKRISGRRTHFSTDGTAELRLSYVPQEVVPIDLSKEVDESIAQARDGLALNSDDDFDVGETVESSQAVVKVFDVTKPDLAWVLEGLARGSVPIAFQDWQQQEQAKAAKKSPKKKKLDTSKKANPSGMPRGALDRYVKASKPSVAPGLSKQPTSSSSRSPMKKPVVEEVGSSPVTPTRSAKLRKAPDPILISSSPAVPSSPLGPASPQRTEHAQLSDAPDTIRSIIQGNIATNSLNYSPPPLQPRRDHESSPTRTSVGKGRDALKQSSMEIFVTKSRSAGKHTLQPTISKGVEQPKDKGGGKDEHEVSDLEPLSDLLPSSSADVLLERTSSAAVGPKERTSRNGPSPKKKLFRSRTSAAGYFEEVEIDADEREEVIDKGRAVSSVRATKSSAVRWSDVSIVDLT